MAKDEVWEDFILCVFCLCIRQIVVYYSADK